MEEKRRLDVNDWQPELRPIQVVQARTSWMPRVPASMMGVSGTILLHALVMWTTLAVTASKKVVSPVALSASITARGLEFESGLLLIAALPDVKEGPTDKLFAQFISRDNLVEAMSIDLAEANTPPAIHIIKKKLSDSAEDESSLNSVKTGRARLVGMYFGQIKARIDREWKRPRSPVNPGGQHGRRSGDDDTFRCEVRITQDDRGNVQDVVLERCNGSAAWRRSLVTAIKQGSPLPAPPDAEVYSSAVTINFSGFPFSPGDADDDYELADEVSHATVDKNF